MSETDRHGRDDHRAGVELLWGSEERASRGPKPGLTLHQIASAGIAIADAEGLGALSMRAIAERLGFTTMSLYRHVPDKTALLAVMIDTAIGESLPISAGDRLWRSELAAWAWQNWDLFHRHPWLMQAEVPGAMTGPRQIAWIEAGLEILAGTGLTGGDMMEIVLFLYGYVHGMAHLSLTWMRHDPLAWESSSLLMQHIAHDPRFPLFRANLAAGVFDEPNDAATSADPMGEGFEFGLQRALDGIAAYMRQRTDPTPGGP